MSQTRSLSLDMPNGVLSLLQMRLDPKIAKPVAGLDMESQRGRGIVAIAQNPSVSTRKLPSIAWIDQSTALRWKADSEVQTLAASTASCITIAGGPEGGPRPPPPEAVLRSCFRLTTSEARLARKICSGQGVEAAADELGVSYETGRNQLKSVFAKTQTHRQSELVALLTRLSNGR
ncbi:hypothetical protein [Mesorhizobium sp.]|uniref:helix-turn-helix transcriptional regulator n=1 Tax=Mesorhizobium sp. TaxID=1871066 RepID=UPI000FE56BCC|nr:hypothetical protein [Mesorhizobium sp.]RWP33453.1 MAG: hypothetical protein EOR03_18200 [Mesorhizobium sp.]